MNSLNQISFTLPGGFTVSDPSAPPGSTASETVERLITASLSLFLVVIILLSFFFLIMGGIRYSVSGGNKTSLQGARDQITWAITGLILALLSFAIVRVVGNVFGIPMGIP